MSMAVRQAYGEEISVDDARHRAHRLVRLYRTLHAIELREGKKEAPEQNAREAS